MLIIIILLILLHVINDDKVFQLELALRPSVATNDVPFLDLVIYIYIYIYKEREREREMYMFTALILIIMNMYIYIYIYNVYTHLSTDIYTGACSHSCRRSRGGDEPALPTGARQPQRNRNINKTQQTISSASRRYERRVMMRARKTIYIYIYVHIYI